MAMNAASKAMTRGRLPLEGGARHHGRHSRAMCIDEVMDRVDSIVTGEAEGVCHDA
jgi:hypothetical protein